MRSSFRCTIVVNRLSGPETFGQQTLCRNAARNQGVAYSFGTGVTQQFIGIRAAHTVGMAFDPQRAGAGPRGIGH